MNTSTLTQKAQFENGTMFKTNEDMLYVLQLNGSWYDMGKQYGNLAKEHMQPMYDKLVQAEINSGLISQQEAFKLFGSRIFISLTTRRKQYFQGVADALGWPVEKVIVLDQCGPMAIYLQKLHSFSGCSSLAAWGESTTDGSTIVGRNMDWSEIFLDFPVYVTVYNPTDGSNGIANVSWPGWTWMVTGFNDKGVYTDLHDGTSMGGNIISVEKPSFLNSVFDFMAESDNAEALSFRYQAAKTDVSSIWMVADSQGSACSYENVIQENRKRVADTGASSFVTVNTFLNPDWGIGVRETQSFSLKRLANLQALHAEKAGQIDAAAMRDIFDLPLYNEDGSFKEHGGVTKPTNQDVDLTNYQVVSDLNKLQMSVKLPALGSDAQWINIDIKALFNQ
ncbi:C45 family autoproteolytic acyltransferase/hydolase [Shewanella sp. TC10]|uniref:C45 family autoproteolytic acyltransferase/hydolase n=1 Tax=Shewanella sp. TC10 TaxID=1419739 RepID=UPI00129DB8A1|nr:C45 family peptidase [Shewanella sp. TC10]